MKHLGEHFLLIALHAFAEVGFCLIARSRLAEVVFGLIRPRWIYASRDIVKSDIALLQESQLRMIALQAVCSGCISVQSRPSPVPRIADARGGSPGRKKPVGNATCATERFAQVDFPTDSAPVTCTGRYSDRFLPRERNGGPRSGIPSITLTSRTRTGCLAGARVLPNRFASLVDWRCRNAM